MVQVIIIADASKIPNISTHIPEIRKKGLSYAGQGLIRTLQRNSPVDHGRLKQWFVYSFDENEMHIRSPAHYVTYVNDGTGIYGPYKTPITHPSIGKKFAFQVNGQMIYTRQIKGQKGQRFVERSIEETQSKIEGFYIKAVREVLK